VTFFIFAIPAGFVALVVYFLSEDGRKVEAAWCQAAKLLGLRLGITGLFENRKLDGDFRSCSVVVTEVARNRGADTRITVSNPGIPQALAIASKGGFADLKKVFIEGGIQVWDGNFDYLFEVQGPEDAVLAALNQDARNALRALYSRGPNLKLSNGALEQMRVGKVRDAVELAQSVQNLVEVAELLRVASVPEALAQNAREDGVAGTRLRNLEVLGLRYAGSPATRAAAEAALADKDPSIRLAAATILGGDQERAAVDEVLGVANLSTELRVAALRRLVEIAPYAQVRPRVAHMLDSTESKVLRAAIAAAGQGRDGSAVERLCELADSDDLVVAGAAAVALGDIGDPLAQASLLRLLGRQSPELFQGEFRNQAVLALGKLGNIDAVEPLLPLANSVLPGALRDAAREAVRRIQSRLGEAGAGRLSVAQVDESAAAGLSVVEPAADAPLKQKG
jgi:HEAT repeat protein